MTRTLLEWRPPSGYRANEADVEIMIAESNRYGAGWRLPTEDEMGERDVALIFFCSHDEARKRRPLTFYCTDADGRLRAWDAEKKALEPIGHQDRLGAPMLALARESIT